MTDLNRVGKYEIRRELGRGAMGVVYEAYDPVIKRLVALKTIRADQLAGEAAEDHLARFRREAQAAGRLNHPNIVSIYDCGEEDGVSYIAMEHIQGRELKDYFQGNERFTTADTVRIMTQMLNALEYAHKQGVVHRDIKPANLFVLADGTVKVADFGIAHIETSNMTQLGTAIGTPAYMSPEQIQGLPVDGRSDLFSAGVILYQFLTGERPFSGSSTTTMRKVLEEDPLPPSRFNVQVPAAMDAVVRKALAKRPEERFQTAREFADALRSAASQDASMAAGPAVAPAAALDATVMNVAERPRSDPVDALPPAAAPPKPSQSSAMMLVVAAVVGALGAGGWYAYQRMSAASPPQQAAASPTTVAATAPASPAAPQPVAPSAPAAAPPPEPGTMVISAVGLVDPSDPRYQTDKSLQQADLRADSKSQLVEKALGLMLDRNSLAKNYDVLKDKLLSKSGTFVTTVVRESEPRLGKDGLVSLTTQAVVNVRAVQKSLNQMSRDERIELIRANGDPKVSVRIDARDADQPGAPPIPSIVAENLLKERIKSFGFRTWAEEGARGDADPKGADFAILGEVKLKKLSMQLPTSGLTATKYTLTSWTIKCIDRATGEEIYFNTTLPKGVGSWATEEEALRAIGGRIADEFSRDFFLQHVAGTGQKVTLKVENMPGAGADDPLLRELIGLPGVILVTAQPTAGTRVYDLQLAGVGTAGDVVAASILKPINAKLGTECFTLGATAGGEVTVRFDARCADAAVLGRFDANPPAGLYGAPPARQKSVIRNPETLRKVMT